MRKFRMPSHGTVVAYCALFASLSGTAVALESNEVTSREIATGAVGRSEIRTGGVGSAEIRTDGVRAREIKAAAVMSPEIASGAVGQSEIGGAAVGPLQIQDGAVGADALGAGAVGTAKLFDGAVTAAKLAEGSVSGTSVADGSLGLADVAQTVATVTYDPPVMNAGDCVGDPSIAVTNKQAGDRALVLPGSASAGWNSDLTLDGYASTGSGGGNTISVALCRRFGAGSTDPGPQPLTVLLFR